MTDAYTASYDSATTGRLRYAEACLKQGMSYQSAARASDVCEADLRDFAPGYASAPRDAPKIMERSPLGRCAVILPHASPEELGQVAALALRLLCDARGINAVQTVCTNAVKAMPARVEVGTPRSRLMSVVDQVADRHGITREQLMSRSHCRRYARPRQEAYWILRRETGLSFPVIGRLFERDHTTILFGYRAYEARLAEALS